MMQRLFVTKALSLSIEFKVKISTLLVIIILIEKRILIENKHIKHHNLSRGILFILDDKLRHQRSKSI